jgi:hypothetical protein
MTPGTCINWTGWRDAESRCKAGFKYHDIVGPEVVGSFLRLPCRQYDVRPVGRPGTYIQPGDRVIRLEIDRKGQQQATCGCYIEPTDDQIEQDRIKTDAALRRTMTAIEVAARWRVRPKPRQDRREVIECPTCKGRLHLSQSSYNGHVHGQCETANCVSWME